MSYIRRLSEDHGSLITFKCKEPGNLREALKLVIWDTLDGEAWFDKSLAANAAFRGIFGAQNTTTDTEFPIHKCHHKLSPLNQAQLSELDELLSIIHLPPYHNLSPYSQTVFRIGMRQWTDPQDAVAVHVDSLLKLTGGKVASKIGVMIGRYDYGLNRKDMTDFGQGIGHKNSLVSGCADIGLRATTVCGRIASSKFLSLSLVCFTDD